MDPKVFFPPEMLKPVIKYFWALDNPVDSPLKMLTAFPDGSPGVIIVQTENGALCDNHNKELPAIYLHGQTIAPSKLSCSGRFSALGVCFQPQALKSIFGLDANEFTQTGIDFHLIQDKRHGDISERLINEQTLEGKIEMLSGYLLLQYQNNHEHTEERINYAVSQIIQSKGTLSLRALQQKLQVSERSLERKFNQSIGISPKLFSRICRFQGSLKQLQASSYDKLSDIAYENEYADQSHLIRTFKEFTGLSPLAFKKQYSIENLTQSI
jgi:AraC-like DNA-binding protein